MSCDTSRPRSDEAQDAAFSYAIGDGYVGVQSLYFAPGSTDSLVVLFLPVMSPAVVLIVGRVSAALTSVLHRPSERRP
jgi:hypothetical protein